MSIRTKATKGLITLMIGFLGYGCPGPVPPTDNTPPVAKSLTSSMLEEGTKTYNENELGSDEDGDALRYRVLSTTGVYTEVGSIWRTDNYDYWYVYGDKDNTKYILPELPNSVTQLFDIDRSAFGLWLTDLKYWPELTSYDDVMNILFNSSDYFYDVVNELRRYTRYNQDDLGKAGSKEVVLSEDIDREPNIEV